MKKIILILFLFISTSSCFSQKYIDTIATKVCECLKNTSDSISEQQLMLKFGICFLDASKNYKTELKRDYNIDFVNNEKGLDQQLGSGLGMSILGACPDLFLKLVGKITPPAKQQKEENKEVTINGVVSKVEKDGFIIFSVKDETGKIAKYYWMTFVESNFDLINNYNKIVGKKVQITCEPYEFFDPKLDEYRNFSIIKKIDFVTN